MQLQPSSTTDIFPYSHSDMFHPCRSLLYMGVRKYVQGFPQTHSRRPNLYNISIQCIKNLQKRLMMSLDMAVELQIGRIQVQILICMISNYKYRKISARGAVSFTCLKSQVKTVPSFGTCCISKQQICHYNCWNHQYLQRSKISSASSMRTYPD